jgi:hypothetical protein
MTMRISTVSPTVQRRSGTGAIVLFAAPLAWFAELNVGYVLATEPCFPADERLSAPAPHWAWTHAGLFGLAGICLLVALWGFLVSYAALRREPGESRNRFAALWGVAFGGGFFVATLLTAVGLILLPRCGG